MLELENVDRTTFAPCVGQTFEAVLTDGRVPLTLAEVRPLGAARPGTTREPFALVFHCEPTVRLPQHIYRLEHATLGEMEIFLVPVAAGQCEAVFS